MMPVTAPSSTTGRWWMRMSAMMSIASKARESEVTARGLGVMISVTGRVTSMLLATTRPRISRSVTIPSSPPSRETRREETFLSSIMRAAS